LARFPIGHLLWLRFWRLNRLGLRFAGRLFQWKFQRLPGDGSQRLTDLHHLPLFKTLHGLHIRGRNAIEGLSLRIGVSTCTDHLHHAADARPRDSVLLGNLRQRHSSAAVVDDLFPIHI
jgi:hypothetical protein